MRPIILQSLVLVLLSLLSYFSWVFLFIPLILMAVYIGSVLDFREGSEKKWTLGWILMRRGKRIVTKTGRFWAVMVNIEDGEYRVYIFQDKIYYLRQIGTSFRHYGMEETKSKIFGIIASHFTKIESEVRYKNRVGDDFRNWDGCLSKEDSRDQKIKKVI